MNRHRLIASILGTSLSCLAGVGVAKAHDFYDPWCCVGNADTGDCAAIPTKSVRPIAGGYQITLSPGDHPRVTRVHVFQIEQSKTRPSKDGRFHICLWPTEANLRCVYVPDMAS